jgi:hypothetical protein
MDPNHALFKPVQQSQLTMKKVMDVTMKDRKMKEWSFSSHHGGLIKTQPEKLKQATLSDAIPIFQSSATVSLITLKSAVLVLTILVWQTLF